MDGIMIIHSLTTWSHYQLERLIGMASTRTENVWLPWKGLSSSRKHAKGRTSVAKAQDLLQSITSHLLISQSYMAWDLGSRDSGTPANNWTGWPRRARRENYCGNLQCHIIMTIPLYRWVWWITTRRWGLLFRQAPDGEWQWVAFFSAQMLPARAMSPGTEHILCSKNEYASSRTYANKDKKNSIQCRAHASWRDGFLGRRRLRLPRRSGSARTTHGSEPPTMAESCSLYSRFYISGSPLARP